MSQYAAVLTGHNLRNDHHVQNPMEIVLSRLPHWSRKGSVTSFFLAWSRAFLPASVVYVIDHFSFAHNTVVRIGPSSHSVNMLQILEETQVECYCGSVNLGTVDTASRLNWTILVREGRKGMLLHRPGGALGPVQGEKGLETC